MMDDIVERLRSADLRDATHATREAADTIEALRAENARLREALKPFADLFLAGDNEYLDWRLKSDYDPRIGVPMTYLRAARAAMGDTK